VAFTGGINLADEYINRITRFGHWKDTAIMVKGEAVRSFTLMFLQMWCHNEKVRVYDKYLLPPEDCRMPSSGYVIPYGDSPLDGERVGEMVYLDMINSAQRYVYIMSPYLILDNETVTALTFAAKRGVDVRIILPHIPDKKYAFSLAKSHYKELISSGVKIYEYTPGFVHAKVVLFDDTKAVVGTINFDYRSLYHHFECAAFLYGVSAIEDIKRDFADTEAKSQHITMEDVAKEKLISRMTGVLLKIVAPLL
jgi:cardiolipin synthase